MKKMKRIMLVLIVASMAMFFTTSIASATTISAGAAIGVTGITDAQFVAKFGAAAILSVSDSAFAFGDGTTGTISSATYKVTIGPTDYYAYVYQVVNSSSLDVVSGITVDEVLSITSDIDFNGGGGDPVFVINSDPGADGLDAPLSTVFNDGFGTHGISSPTDYQADKDWDVDFAGTGLDPGVTSYLFGFVSLHPPHIIVGTIKDGGGVVTNPNIVSTTPEPTTMLLLGTGLLGLMGVGYRRRRLS